MPFCVKFGLGGTGYLGKTESHLRAARRRAARRKIEDGFPIITPFASIVDVRLYLAGDRITCLLCGQAFKDLGKHLRLLHGVDPDRYRETYRIPFTYPLCCRELSARHSINAKEKLARGIVLLGGQERMNKMRSVPPRVPYFKAEIATMNLGDNSKYFREPDNQKNRRPFVTCLECGTDFKLRRLRRNQARIARGEVFCSRSCVAKWRRRTKPRFATPPADV